MERSLLPDIVRVEMSHARRPGLIYRENKNSTVDRGEALLAVTRGTYAVHRGLLEQVSNH